jgi:hypothetical protein
LAATSTLRELGRRIAGADPVDLALRLTLLDLLLRPVGFGMIRPLVLGLAAAGLIVPAWLRSPPLWLGLALLTGLRVLLDRPLQDNHAYLLSYWCLAVFLCRITSDDGSTLALNGRLLVGLAFLFATRWKLTTPDYMDGTFFQVTMLLDARLEGFTRLFGGMTPGEIEGWRALLLAHVDGAAAEPVPALALSSRFSALAMLGMLWTVVWEAALAVAFLWPVGRGPSRLRHPLLLVFCGTTYAFATVEGFGWLLVAMGVAQCEPERTGTRALYLLAFLAILFYREVPWASLLADLLA